MIKRAYQYRLYPTKTQAVLISKTFGCVRLFWNKCVELFNEKKEIKSYTEITNQFEFMKEISMGAINFKMQDFRATKKQFFSKTRKAKIGRPAFKSKRTKQSYRLEASKFRIKDSKIRLEKIGWVRIIKDREYEGRELSVTISRDFCGDYWASILVEQDQPAPLAQTGQTVGIDLGIKHLVITSDGDVFDLLPDNQRKIKHIQRRLASKAPGSLMFKRLKLRLAKLHRSDARRRNHVLHNISSFLTLKYDAIKCEDLNVKGMMKNHKLAGAIGRQGLSELVRQIEYKAQWRGRSFAQVDRFFASSKTCSKCGNIKKELKLSERVYYCDVCGVELDRDLNAAINIKAVEIDAASKQSAMGCKTKRSLANVTVISNDRIKQTASAGGYN